MSGRSGYRKTDRKRNRNAKPSPRSEYVLRFQLPKSLAFALRPGQHGWGITIGFNDIVFVAGQRPTHCCDLAAGFLDKIGARQWAQTIEARIVKLLPCPAHCPPAAGGFKPIGIDLEAIHDRISRNADRARPCAIVIASDSISFAGVAPKRFTFEFPDRHRSDRRSA